MIIKKKDLVKRDMCLTQAKIQEAIDELRGAVTICYPMGLPPHDPIQMEFENKEDLEGTQVKREEYKSWKMFKFLNFTWFY